jgi:predicted ArsR family transcriptional regulator
MLQDRLRELDDERAQVEKALADLGGGTRRDEAVKMVAAHPGISAGQIAKEMKIQPNYMYRVMSELEKEGLVRKEGRGYHPAA